MTTKTSYRKRDGITLTEVLFSIAIVGILAALLVPAISSAKERAIRAKCRNNLRQIGIGANVYAVDNSDYLISAKQQEPWKKESFAFVQVALYPESAKAAEQAGLTMQSNNVWTCPNRPGLPVYEENEKYQIAGSWTIGYQYFGGIKTWMNPRFPNGVSSRSPIRLSQSRPAWCLAADAVIKVSGKWGKNNSADRPVPWSNLPPHHEKGNLIPTGGNELMTDGSVAWIPFYKMSYLTTWQPDFDARVCLFYQDASDFDPELRTNLALLSANRFK